jgi:hypothetical protein
LEAVGNNWWDWTVVDADDDGDGVGDQSIGGRDRTMSKQNCKRNWKAGGTGC